MSSPHKCDRFSISNKHYIAIFGLIQEGIDVDIDYQVRVSNYLLLDCLQLCKEKERSPEMLVWLLAVENYNLHKFFRNGDFYNKCVFLLVSRTSLLQLVSLTLHISSFIQLQYQTVYTGWAKEKCGNFKHGFLSTKQS